MHSIGVLVWLPYIAQDRLRSLESRGNELVTGVGIDTGNVGMQKNDPHQDGPDGGSHKYPVAEK